MKQVFILSALILLGISGIVGGIATARQLSRPSQPCNATGSNHVVVFQDGQATPRSITAKKCDTLTIVSQEDTSRLIAFGAHNRHTPYNGSAERNLPARSSISLTFDTVGEYVFHDHYQESVGATFTVTN